MDKKETSEPSGVLNESRNWDKFTKDIIKREREAIKESKEKRIKETFHKKRRQRKA